MAPQNQASDFGAVTNPVVSYSPLVFTVPGRQVALQIKVSAPAMGNYLPIILLSHGHGSTTFGSLCRFVQNPSLGQRQVYNNLIINRIDPESRIHKIKTGIVSEPTF